MKTREMASEYRMAQWAEVLRDRRESGESVKDYCRTRGISRDRYYYWQRKLREAACNELAAVQSGNAGQGPAPAGFAEVRVQSETRSLGGSGMQDGGLVAEMQGIRLSAGCGYPADKLAYLLRELVKAC